MTGGLEAYRHERAWMFGILRVHKCFPAFFLFFWIDKFDEMSSR